MTWPELTLSFILAGASIADGRTTSACIQHRGCIEANPLMKGRAFWPVMAATSAFPTWTSHELRKRRQKRWWLPVVAGIGLHAAAAQHNHGVSRP